MDRTWPLHVAVDAVADSDTSARLQAASRPGARPHVIVQLGALRIQCLDGRAVHDLASAWARAETLAGRMLPATPPPRQVDHGRGVAVPIADVVVDGPQSCHVRVPGPGQPFATITSAWFTMRIHDQVALTVQSRAWARAVDLGVAALRPTPLPFNQLLARERERQILDQYQLDHRGRRRHDR